MGIHHQPLIPGFRHSFPAITPDRESIEFQIEDLLNRVTILVARLDFMDGDADLEECDAEDSFTLSPRAISWRDSAGPGCPISDPKEIDDEPEDEGDREADSIIATAPIYGADQSRGPTNEREAVRTHQLALMQPR